MVSIRITEAGVKYIRTAYVDLRDVEGLIELQEVEPNDASARILVFLYRDAVQIYEDNKVVFDNWGSRPRPRGSADEAASLLQYVRDHLRQQLTEDVLQAGYEVGKGLADLQYKMNSLVPIPEDLDDEDRLSMIEDFYRLKQELSRLIERYNVMAENLIIWHSIPEETWGRCIQ